MRLLNVSVFSVFFYTNPGCVLILIDLKVFHHHRSWLAVWLVVEASSGIWTDAALLFVDVDLFE